MSSMSSQLVVAFLLAGAILCDTVAAGQTYKVWARNPEEDNKTPWLSKVIKVYATDENYPFTPKDTLMGTAYYDDAQDTKGWGIFSYTADAKAMNSYPYLSWYAAGFVEGYATFKRIDQVYSATIARTLPLSDDATQFLNLHLDFMNSTLSPFVDPVHNNNNYSTTLQKLLLQVKGLADGYTHRRVISGGVNSHIGFWEMFLINLDNELPDFISAAQYHNNKSVDRDDTERLRGAHCSGLIKWTGDELFVSQVTWAGYEIFIGRQYKTYNMITTNVSMTTNAGHIVSGDDYFITSNKLSIIETTNDFYNSSLYQYITPDTVSEFLRVMIANYVATSGEEWTTLFAKRNSGTYCNQWMVIDYKEFHSSSDDNVSALGDNVLWVAEQIPGYVVSRSESDTLRTQTYWPSYNIPADKTVRELSGFTRLEKQYGLFFSYDNTSRANIFRRDHSKVTNRKTMQKMMRYNDYENDELSTIPNCSDCSPARSPYLSIASRGDLVKDLQGYIPTGYAMFFARSPFGAVDAKITSAHMINYMVSDIVQGPTHDQQPVFSWNEFPGDWRATAPGMQTKFDYTFKTWNENGPYKIPMAPFDSTEGKRIMGGVIGGCTAALLLSIFLVWYTQHRPLAKHVPLA